MADVDEVQVSLVRDELRAATDVGEHRSRQQLQEVCGIGSGDLDAVLDSLQADGKATEQAPDEWVLSRGDDGAVPEVEDRELDDGEPEEGADGPYRPDAAQIPGRPRVPEEADEDVRVSMPVAVAKSMEAAALGGIVEAGIQEAMERGSSFVLVVES